MSSSARPPPVVPPGGLETARRRAGLTVDELWVRYFGNGGAATFTELQSFLVGDAWPSALQYDITVSALNDRFTEMDLNHPIPYAGSGQAALP